MNARPSLRFSAAPIGRMRHPCGGHLDRHCHREAFAAVVLSGGYVEAGDRGRCRVGPGDVVLHSHFEAHQDHFSGAGAEVLVLPLVPGADYPDFGRVADPDRLVRLAESDPCCAADFLLANLLPGPPVAEDWPDRLARDLRACPDLELGDWAARMGLCRESVARGFGRAYGVPPVTFRAAARTLLALSRIDPARPLADVAFACGFADQAHMTRSIGALTGRSPSHWRKLRAYAVESSTL